MLGALLTLSLATVMWRDFSESRWKTGTHTAPGERFISGRWPWREEYVDERNFRCRAMDLSYIFEVSSNMSQREHLSPLKVLKPKVFTLLFPAPMTLGRRNP